MNMNRVICGSFPFSQQEQSSVLVKGEDIYLYDRDGRKYVDMCSGLWNVPLGYSNENIKKHVIRQLEELPYNNLIAFQSDIQQRYASMLIDWLSEEDFSKVLYTCSGSETTEAAIKTCRQFQVLSGCEQKKTIGAFSISYHGTSYGAMSVSGLDRVVTKDYQPVLSGISFMEIPGNYNDEEEWMKYVDSYFDKYGENLAGFMAEPVLASGGIIPVPFNVLRYIACRCREYGALFVEDEVATGFGRTGIPFLYQQAGLKPDLLCLSKAVNNGYLPLGILVYGSECAGKFTESDAAIEHFSTQGGNALALAAAEGMLECMRDYGQYHVMEKGKYFAGLLREGLNGKAEIRNSGLMIAVDLPSRYAGADVLNIMELFKKRGIVVYMYNNDDYNRGISFFPPFIISKSEIEKYSGQILSVLRRIV